MRRFAQDTAVPVAQSRGEIDLLLRRWKCDVISWSDDFSGGEVRLTFVWSRDELKYAARFTLKMPTCASLTKEMRGLPTDRSIQNAREKKWRSLHRVLLLWLKGCFNAVDAGLVSAEAIFLPFLLGKDGRTVADVFVPRMTELFAGSADRLMIGGPE